jgi:hypothetical protein
LFSGLHLHKASLPVWDLCSSVHLFWFSSISALAARFPPLPPESPEPSCAFEVSPAAAVVRGASIHTRPCFSPGRSPGCDSPLVCRLRALHRMGARIRYWGLVACHPRLQTFVFAWPTFSPNASNMAHTGPVCAAASLDLLLWSPLSGLYAERPCFSGLSLSFTLRSSSPGPLARGVRGGGVFHSLAATWGAS